MSTEEDFMPQVERKFTPRAKARSIRGNNVEVADWASASAEAIKKAIESAGAVGGALRFGYSGDGGAYAVGCYFDGESWTEFIRPAEDIDNFLEQVREYYEEQGMSPERGQASKNGAKKRS